MINKQSNHGLPILAHRTKQRSGVSIGEMQMRFIKHTARPKGAFGIAGGAAEKRAHGLIIAIHQWRNAHAPRRRIFERQIKRALMQRNVRFYFLEPQRVMLLDLG